MIHRISEILACRLTNYIGWQDKTETVTYGLELIIGELLKFSLLIIFSALLGLLNNTILILAAALPLRLVSGGGHCTTYLRCTITTISIYLILSFVARWFMYFPHSNYILNSFPLLIMLSLIIIQFWVPGQNPNRVFDSVSEKIKFKRLSFLFILLWVTICYLVLLVKPQGLKMFYISTATGIAWQMLFVSPLGYGFLAKIEGLFNLLKTRKEVS